MKRRSVKSDLNSLVVTLAVTVAITSTGCTDMSSPSRATPAGHSNKERYEVTVPEAAPYGALLKAHTQGEQRALRIKVDAARNRLWVLGLNHVYIYDITAKQLVRRIALPKGSVAGFVCSPDMALDRSGAAIISSNVESTLWKIDADDFAIRAQVITSLASMNRDIGFGALTFAADGTLYALAAHAGSLWRINMATLHASEVALSERLLNTCTLVAPEPAGQGGPPRTVVLCAAAGKHLRHIAITPDFTRGHVSTEKCPS